MGTKPKSLEQVLGSQGLKVGKIEWGFSEGGVVLCAGMGAFRKAPPAVLPLSMHRKKGGKGERPVF